METFFKHIIYENKTKMGISSHRNSTTAKKGITNNVLLVIINGRYNCIQNYKKIFMEQLNYCKNIKSQKWIFVVSGLKFILKGKKSNFVMYLQALKFHFLCFSALYTILRGAWVLASSFSWGHNFLIVK